MIDINISCTIPFLWNGKTFSKDKWGPINVIVGPNGTGKSLFADQLRPQLTSQGFKVRPFTAERLFGMEKADYSHFGSRRHGNEGLNISEFQTLKQQGTQFGLAKDAFVILKERLDVRIKIEAVLSDIFQKTIHLVEEGGFLKPKMQNVKSGGEYILQDSECHGLKEIITLLTFIYDPSNNCIILDEPEMHLHPQFQSFFLTEAKKVSGDPRVDPTKKLFFLVTHSPYFIDVSNIEDLSNVVVCHYADPPSYISDLDADDTWRLEKLLPRLNTHHKQFFFSANPVFVEGYTDQYLITALFEKLSQNIEASGSCVIDVGGKDEVEMFYRVSRTLNLDARAIVDLDALFKGKLRQTISNDERAQQFVQNHGIGVNLSQEIGALEAKLSTIAAELIARTSDDPELNELIQLLKSIPAESAHKLRCITLQGLLAIKQTIQGAVNEQSFADINMICGKYKKILEAFEVCGVYILEQGEIENYYVKTHSRYINQVDKAKAFEEEREYIAGCNDVAKLSQDYPALISMLQKAVSNRTIDFTRHLKYELIRWMQSLQLAITRNEVDSAENLKTNARVNYALYNQLFDLVAFNINKDTHVFECTIKLKPIVSEKQEEIILTEETVAKNFSV